jgi:L-lactate dehydrogenase complex protein LldE
MSIRRGRILPIKSSVRLPQLVPARDADAFFPEVGVATLELLKCCGVDVLYSLDQTCCGQPMANSGCQSDAVPTETLSVENFKEFDYIVAPSGSCTHHVRSHFDAIPQAAEVKKVC